MRHLSQKSIWNDEIEELTIQDQIDALIRELDILIPEPKGSDER